MSISVHRNDDSRKCGAKTIVSGQSTVFANGKLIAVDGDKNDHGQGSLTANCNKVFINGKLIVKKGNSAESDSLCSSEGGDHCSPDAISGSENVFVG